MISFADVAKVALLLFLAGILQAAILSGVDVLGGRPDILLVTLASVALLRGSVYGAVAGFAAGLLMDTAALGTLGLTSLILTIAGYWIGRYGETTGRDRTHAPYLSVGVITVAYLIGSLVIRFVLGEQTAAGHVLLGALLPSVVLNVLLTGPVYWLTRRLLGPATWTERAQEVRLLG